jgi:hypothetical protein
MMCLIVICVWRGSTISQTSGTNETHASKLAGFPVCSREACCIRRGSNHRPASLTTYLFLFSMITNVWSGFREPQKDRGNGEYLHFQFVWSFGVFCVVLFLSDGVSIQVWYTWATLRFSFKKTTSEYGISSEMRTSE